MDRVLIYSGEIENPQKLRDQIEESFGQYCSVDVCTRQQDLFARLEELACEAKKAGGGAEAGSTRQKHCLQPGNRGYPVCGELLQKPDDRDERAAGPRPDEAGRGAGSDAGLFSALPSEFPRQRQGDRPVLPEEDHAEKRDRDPRQQEKVCAGQGSLPAFPGKIEGGDLSDHRVSSPASCWHSFKNGAP